MILLINGPEMLSQGSDKSKCLQKNFLNTWIFVTPVSFYLLFFQGLIYNHIIFMQLVTLKLVKKVITNLDFSKISGPDCIPVVLHLMKLLGLLIVLGVLELQNLIYLRILIGFAGPNLENLAPKISPAPIQSLF